MAPAGGGQRIPQQQGTQAVQQHARLVLQQVQIEQQLAAFPGLVRRQQIKQQQAHQAIQGQLHGKKAGQRAPAHAAKQHEPAGHDQEQRDLMIEGADRQHQQIRQPFAPQQMVEAEGEHEDDADIVKSVVIEGRRPHAQRQRLSDKSQVAADEQAGQAAYRPQHQQHGQQLRAKKRRYHAQLRHGVLQQLRRENEQHPMLERRPAFIRHDLVDPIPAFLAAEIHQEAEKGRRIQGKYQVITPVATRPRRPLQTTQGQRGGRSQHQPQDQPEDQQRVQLVEIEIERMPARVSQQAVQCRQRVPFVGLRQQRATAQERCGQQHRHAQGEKQELPAKAVVVHEYAGRL